MTITVPFNCLRRSGYRQTFRPIIKIYTRVSYSGYELSGGVRVCV